MPVYEFKELPPYRDKYMAEILKDGEALWENLPGAKRQLIFGVGKARMMECCLEVIKQFHDSDGLLPSSAGNLALECTDKYGTRYRIERRAWNNIPYLEIREIAVFKQPVSLGIGRMKAMAIIELQKEIARFASRKT